MSQSHACLLIHLIFSTKERLPLLHQAIREELFCYLAGIANAESITTHCIGGIENHVHLLISLSRTKTLAKTVEILKTQSSKWLKTKGSEFFNFSWQNGYGAFSVSYSQFEIVCKYIRNQVEHHRKMDYKEELTALLKRHNMKYDENYLWN